MHELSISISSSSSETIGILGLILALAFYFSFTKYQTPPSCDMKRPENLSFSAYYGIIDSENHFMTTRADGCASRIIYESVLPPMILNSDHSATSFMTLAGYGTGERFQKKASVKHLYGEHFQDLVEFSSFIKTYFKKTPVFVIDGIDENVHFRANEINKASFESFCRSSVSASILSMVMASHFHLSLFYPKIDGVNIEDFISRKDKFPIHTITWNTKFLINYAEYVLQDMNKNANETRCKAFPDFKTLVNYSNWKNAEIIDKIRTPRALHYFVEKLIVEMNGDASDAAEPFRATFENVDNAYKQALKSSEKKTDG
ncbi:unnamed protein product [Adineta steineri]|uniref:Uncharacterized protein n=1 Tax=Adineta steineri TaxID=433720 RepID=A0A818XM70_9BILA|nr:unnamed protein product [Adineta steineri]CAF1211109.1 unnamed protein product [Adineta steineri]CAF3737567.1 unnamed protein product [Adineta steineri]CAF3742481.1 unnamed protein product [Adineta steineri]CAF4085989.1 unnamed protein product [Adineta steineri]